MVDISNKEVNTREAEAEGRIKLNRATIDLINKGQIEKGDVITVAKTSAIIAAKQTANIIPMCHQIPLENVKVDIEVNGDEIVVKTHVKANYKTGVEMEALVAAASALLTIWDMVKKYEKDEEGQYPNTCIKEIKVLRKTKG